VAHRRGSLVETIIWSLPVEDAHLQQVVQDIIGHLLPIHHQEISLCPDHVCPEDVVVVKVEEAVLLPPFLNNKRVLSILPSETNTVGTSIKDLEALFNIVAPGNIIQYLPL